jgi:hypothetical protein
VLSMFQRDQSVDRSDGCSVVRKIDGWRGGERGAQYSRLSLYFYGHLDETVMASESRSGKDPGDAERIIVSLQQIRSLRRLQEDRLGF